MSKEKIDEPEIVDAASDTSEQAAVANDQQTVEDPKSVEEVAQQAENVAALAQQVDELKDQYLRAKAEMENIRRRADKQVSDSRKFAIDGFAKELLGVRDSLQLAAEVEVEAEDSDAVKSMQEGLGLTLKQLDSVFKKFSIQEIAPQAGDKLDPNLHQAMTMVPAEDVAAGCIISTMQKGYQLHERLLRPAMVVVAKAPDA